jgi:hypothetical protein
MNKIEVEVLEKPCPKPQQFRNSFQALKKPKQKLALKVNDLTDKIFKDLPVNMNKTLVVSPKLTTKIIASAESSLLNERTEHKKRFEKRQKLVSWARRKKSPFEHVFKDLSGNSEFSSEKREKVNASTLARPASPWLYQGRSRYYSVFS